jgi:SAM-dependent methyltransferase
MVLTATSTACPLCAGRTTPSSQFTGTDLRFCQECEFTFLAWEGGDELYHDEYFAQYLGGDYLSQEPQRRHESRLRLDLLESVTQRPARLLEIGAAAGFFLDEARDRGCEGIGVEPNPAMGSHAREQLRLDVRTGRLGEIELPERFDAACAFHVIEHLPHPLEAMKQIRELVVPGGHVLVEVPNAQSASARRMGPRWKPLDLPHHLGHHGARSLQALFTRAGLEPLLIDTIPFAYYSRAWGPLALAAGALEGMRAGAPASIKPHPNAHQLLRGVARRPAT